MDWVLRVSEAIQVLTEFLLNFYVIYDSEKFIGVCVLLGLFVSTWKTRSYVTGYRIVTVT
jgi:hypothetical protein